MTYTMAQSDQVPLVGEGQVPGSPQSGFGLNLSAGMEAAVAFALSLLMKILGDINNQELEQYQKTAEANKQVSIYSAKSTVQAGKDRFLEYLAQGAGALGGGLLTLGTVGYGFLKDPHKVQLKQLEQEKQGIENYQQVVQKKQNTLRPIEVMDEPVLLNRQAEGAAQERIEQSTENRSRRSSEVDDFYNENSEREPLLESSRSSISSDGIEEIEMTTSTRRIEEENADLAERASLSSEFEPEERTLSQTRPCSEEIEHRLKQLKSQKFTDENGQPIRPSETYGENVRFTDEELIVTMSRDELFYLEGFLEENIKDVLNKRDKLVKQQSDRHSLTSTTGQTLGQVISNSGFIGAGIQRKAAGEDDAQAQLSNAASQGMQTILGQFLKISNDVLEKVQQLPQIFAAISNGNKFQA